MTKNCSTLWAIERSILFVCAAGIVSIIVPQMSSPFEEGLNLIVISSTFVGIFIILGITCFPFFVFYLISRHIGRENTSLSLCYSRIKLAAFITLVSWWLYYEAVQSIQTDSSSTGSLVFLFLPIYIVIGGSILYRVLARMANKDA